MDPFDGVEDELEFCRDCNLPMYQIDDPKKFMVFACRACGLEEPRDYFYSLENKRINGIPVLPGVKNQGDRDTCLPTSLITVLESAIKTAKAEINEEFNQELSLDDLLMQYKEIVGIEYEHDKDDTDADLKVDRTKCLNGILVEDGVTLKDNPEGVARITITTKEVKSRSPTTKSTTKKEKNTTTTTTPKSEASWTTSTACG